MSNKVSGKVLLKETGIGIPDLLIEVYDIDPNTKPEIIVQFTQNNPNFAANSPNFWQNFSGDRLGSVPTDESGKFELVYEDDDFQTGETEGKRPDLMVLVIAPEEKKDAPCPQILHISCGIRQNAGRVENYIIKLTKKQLEDAGIELPQAVTGDSQQPEIVIKRMAQAVERQEQITEGFRQIASQRVKQERELTKTLEANTAKVLESLSSVPLSLRKSLSYVHPGESIEQVNARVIEADIAHKINKPTNRAPIKGQIRLSDNLKQRLEPYKNATGDYVNVPEKVVDPYIFGRSETTVVNNGSEPVLFAPPVDEEPIRERSSYLLQEDPLVKLCREKTIEERNARICLDLESDDDEEEREEEENPDNPDDEPINFLGNGVSLADNGNASSYIAKNIEKLMAKVASPEAPVIFNQTEPLTRANQEDIQDNIKNFSLKSSPADTTAYYDFHNLQIAFNHVWQEIFDDDIREKITIIQQQIIYQGGNIDELTKSAVPLKNLAAEAKVAYTAKGFFDQILDQIKETTRDQKGKDEVRRPPIRDHRGEDEVRRPPTLTGLISQLGQRLKENYAFKAFGAGGQERSINYGILVTYRQKWEPINYQVGELVKTIPLAPKEVRKFSKKMTVKKTRSQKEVENNLTSSKEESDSTSRAEDSIIRKANSKTNFSLTASGSFDIPVIGEGSQTTTFGTDAGKESEEAKKSFREAVIKAAHEYKQERKLEISTEESEEYENIESGEISNVNDELSVTFLFYELQRRYRVSEKIHRLTPVVLVAQAIPNPKDIDEDWLIAHDWILKRIILDDSFLPALAYLSTRFAGDEIALQQLCINVEEHRKLVQGLKNDVVAINRQVNRRYAMLEQAINKQAGIEEDSLLEELSPGLDLATDAVEAIGGLFGFGGDKDDDREANRIRREAAENAYEKFANEEKLLRSRLEREVTALNAATESYTKALREHENYKVQIYRLRLHIKQNIMYYMQGIWSHEPPDQRFLRLSQTKVPVITGTKTYRISGTPKQTISSNFARRSFPDLPTTTIPTHNTEVGPELETVNEDENLITLVEVADLDNMLGFKGNYMIFPLKKSNIVTDLMMEPYIDKGFSELIDPDDIGNWTLEEFSKYICCLKEKLSPEDFESIKEELKEQYQAILTSPRRTYEDIIIPTGSLFIEALPGTHPLLEDFKLMHRAIDVKKVQAEVRGEELENLRMAARLLAEDYEDPDIEKKIVIEGKNSNFVLPVSDE